MRLRRARGGTAAYGNGDYAPADPYAAGAEPTPMARWTTRGRRASAWAPGRAGGRIARSARPAVAAADWRHQDPGRHPRGGWRPRPRRGRGDGRASGRAAAEAAAGNQVDKSRRHRSPSSVTALGPVKATGFDPLSPSRSRQREHPVRGRTRSTESATRPGHRSGTNPRNSAG